MAMGHMDPCQGSIVPEVERKRARMTVCGHDAAGRRTRGTPGVPGRGRSVRVQRTDHPDTLKSGAIGGAYCLEKKRSKVLCLLKFNQDTTSETKFDVEEKLLPWMVLFSAQADHEGSQEGNAPEEVPSSSHLSFF